MCKTYSSDSKIGLVEPRALATCLLYLKNIYIYLYLTSWIVCTELEFSKGLQRIYQSCKQTITQVRTNLTQVLYSLQDWLVFFLMRLFLCPSATHALLLHLLSGSGAGPGAELWDASGSLHPAEPDLHHGIYYPYISLLVLFCIIVYVTNTNLQSGKTPTCPPNNNKN